MSTLKIFSFLIILANTNLFGQLIFDYSGAELIIEQYTENKDHTDKIVNNAGYQHILEHSKLYSSNPLTESNLRNSMNEKNEGFDFSHVKDRKNDYIEIIKYLKNNEQKIKTEYAGLCIKYLPDSYKQTATIYYVIGGYNGIAFNNKICMNIDFEQFRNNKTEIELYIAHELFHIGFEKYQPIPDIFKAETVKDLKEVVLAMTMNEGLATLTPYHKRIETNEITDNDYKILLDTVELNKKINQFNLIIKYLDKNSTKELTNEILGNILGQCSGDRLFYIVGCYIGLKIEEKYGSNKIRELVNEGHVKFFETYHQL